MTSRSDLNGSKVSLDIAVVGSGISGLAAAWLLAQRHRVTVFEGDSRIGGHSHTVDVGPVAVDTGFIVYNETTYPNLTALFRHLDVPTRASNMSFSVSLDDGRLEYSGTGLSGLFAQRRNLANPRFWGMLGDLLRFYRNAPRDLDRIGLSSLEEYLDAGRYGVAFRHDHLYPMASAIWSTPAMQVGCFPAADFIRFCDNHGLLKLSGRPLWRTVEGGSRTYVERLTRSFADRIVTGCRVEAVSRSPGGVEIRDSSGATRRFDHVVIGAHADQALAMLTDPSDDERRILGAFSYSRNVAVLHADASLMPKRRSVWASWNYGTRPTSPVVSSPSVTYWMNRLQGIDDATPLFLTLNPSRQPAADLVIQQQTYEHPTLNRAATEAQAQLWSLQGVGNTWFCGAYFGAGFHEDGLQAGLAAAERLGGVRRPWQIEDESNRICVEAPAASRPVLAIA